MDIKIDPQALEPSLTLDDPAPSPGGVDGGAAARFTELMESPGAAAGVTPAAEAVEGATAAARTLGDNILNGLQRMSSEMQQTWSNVGAALGGAGQNLGMRDMLRMQLGLSTMSIQYELVGKAVSRSTQNIDQLVKLQ